MPGFGHFCHRKRAQPPVMDSFHDFTRSVECTLCVNRRARTHTLSFKSRTSCRKSASVFDHERGGAHSRTHTRRAPRLGSRTHRANLMKIIVNMTTSGPYTGSITSTAIPPARACRTLCTADGVMRANHERQSLVMMTWWWWHASTRLMNRDFMWMCFFSHPQQLPKRRKVRGVKYFHFNACLSGDH